MSPRLLPLLAAAALAAGAAAGDDHVPKVRPGGLVIWRGEAVTSCSLAGRSWAPLAGACHFPVDLLATGELLLERKRAGAAESLRVGVAEYPYPTQVLEVDDRMVHLSKADQQRVAREAALVTPLWAREAAPGFTLPLGAPLDNLPGSGRFGARRVFNKEPKSPHAGADYRAAPGAPVRAAAGGTVALTGDHFFAGKSVYVDHGGGLITMYFHLSRIAVRPGQKVERGQVIGAVGSTGRAVGPHLHFAVRWHGARIDPELLLGRTAEAAPLVVDGSL